MNKFFAELEVPKLEAIIFAEFDNEIGRVIKYQVIINVIVQKLILRKWFLDSPRNFRQATIWQYIIGDYTDRRNERQNDKDKYVRLADHGISIWDK